MQLHSILQAFPAAKHSQYDFWHFDFKHLHLFILFSIYLGLEILYCIENGFFAEQDLGLSSISKNFNFGFGDSLKGDAVPQNSSVLIRLSANLMKELQFSVDITIINSRTEIQNHFRVTNIIVKFYNKQINVNIYFLFI